MWFAYRSCLCRWSLEITHRPFKCSMQIWFFGVSHLGTLHCFRASFSNNSGLSYPKQFCRSLNNGTKSNKILCLYLPYFALYPLSGEETIQQTKKFCIKMCFNCIITHCFKSLSLFSRDNKSYVGFDVFQCDLHFDWLRLHLGYSTSTKTNWMKIVNWKKNSRSRSAEILFRCAINRIVDVALHE